MSAFSATSRALAQRVPPCRQARRQPACGVQEQLVPARQQMPRHGRAHDAKADETEVHVLLLLRCVWADRI